MPTGQAIPRAISANYDTLLRAVEDRNVCLLSALSMSGEQEYVVCALQPAPDGGVQFVPFARMFTGNPYEELQPPGSPDEPADREGRTGDG
jgi:hypothetical protein